MAKGRKAHFHTGAATERALDRALELAQIQKLNASAAKDRQSIRESINKSSTTIKGA